MRKTFCIYENPFIYVLLPWQLWATLKKALTNSRCNSIIITFYLTSIKIQLKNNTNYKSHSLQLGLFTSKAMNFSVQVKSLAI